MQKYGHNKSARTFIESLQNDKHKLCSTITQYVFSYGHISTKMGEGFNNKIKGKQGLKQYLPTANTLTLLKLMDCLARDQNIEAIKILQKLREEDRPRVITIRQC